VISAAGEQIPRRFDIPVATEELQGWVKLRPLTAREALQREAVGLDEEYELGPDGAARRLHRRYDQEAMVQFELQRCLVDYELPMRLGCGDVVAATPDECPREELLDRLPAGLAAWLHECLETVNMRRPEDAAVLAAGKDD
jgi:hypothetical protein